MVLNARGSQVRVRANGVWDTSINILKVGRILFRRLANLLFSAVLDSAEPVRAWRTHDDISSYWQPSYGYRV